MICNYLRKNLGVSGLFSIKKMEFDFTQKDRTDQ